MNVVDQQNDTKCTHLSGTILVVDIIITGAMKEIIGNGMGIS